MSRRRARRRAGMLASASVLAFAVVLSGCVGSMAAPQAGAGGDGSQQSLAFANVTAESGLAYRGSDRGIGAGNTGVYAGDVDRDGWTDLLVTGGERPALYRNDGGTFRRQPSFPGVDAAVKSASLTDYDGDGWPDVLLFVPDGQPIALHNDGGTFERDHLGLGNLTYPLGALGVDYDADGDRDLLVYQSGNWATGPPEGYVSSGFDTDNGNPNVLYERREDGFERASGTGLAGERWSLAASVTDLTGDGLPDVHVANDYNNDTVAVNQGDGTFEQRRLGGATARNGMASEVADVTGDGRPDVFVTNIYLPLERHREEIGQERYERIERLYEFVIRSHRAKGNTLLANQGDGRFRDVADERGVRRGGWGWAASLADLDNDGDRDLVHSTQAVVRIDRDDPVWTLPQVWQRNATGFERVNASVHGMDEHDGRGLATLDYDRDGDRDVVIATYGGPFVLYENRVADGNSLQLRVVDGQGATALGATVTVTPGGGATKHLRQADTSDFLSQDAPVLHAGVGDAESATVTVVRPDGTERTYEGVATNRRYRATPDGLDVVAAWNRTGA